VAAAPVLVIGLDMGDGRLIGDWARTGHLPALAALLRGRGADALETTAETLHVSGWPSLYTGTHPGEHGVYYTFQPAPGRQGWLKFQGDQYGRPTLWTLLSGAGVRCSVLDAPYTHPEPGSTAAQVIDWGSWAPYWKPSSSPGDLLGRMQRARGRYPLGFHALDVGMNRLDPAEMSRKLVPAARAKTEAALWLLGERPWDLFFTVYGESHAAAHYCWGDEAALRAVYQEIDRGIGALIERAGPGASVYVISGDGVGPNHAGWHLLPEVLRRLGYLVEPSDTAPAPGASGPPARRALDPRSAAEGPAEGDREEAPARRPPAPAGPAGRHRGDRLGPDPGVLSAHRPRRPHPGEPPRPGAAGMRGPGRGVPPGVRRPRRGARPAHRPGHRAPRGAGRDPHRRDLSGAPARLPA
jgi:hypothetical protein